MTSRGAGLPRVNDFSTIAGSSRRSYTSNYAYQIAGQQLVSFNDSGYTGYRYKSFLTRGQIDPFTRYRKATNYSRIIHTCENFYDTFSWTTRGTFGSAPTTHKLRGPINGTGFTMSDGGMYSYTTGAVGVNTNYVQRALNEAYEALLNTKINLAVAAAELGEVISWLGSLFTRLVKALLIVKDALRGKIRMAAAKRKLAKNNRIVPNTRVSNNRLRDLTYRGGSATDVRWQGINRSYQWRHETAKRFAKNEARKVKFRPRRSASNKVGGAWLEYQYALMPLIYDIFGALEVLEEGLKGDSLLFTVQRTVGGPVDPARFVYSSYQHQVTGTVRQSARVVFAGRMYASQLTKASELGLHNPWAVAWELMPFSFVVDWVLPISKVLNSITAPLGITFVDGHLSEVIYGNFEAVQTLPAGGVFLNGDKPRARFKLLAFQRSTYLTWPWTLFYIRSPWSYAHVATGLALLAQLYKK